MDTAENRDRLERLFPNLASTGYAIKSDETSDYNCFAYAAGDETIQWDPDDEPYTRWPASGVKDDTIASLADAYRSVGFEFCVDGSFEEGIEKIAIYGTADEKCRHAALQRENEWWASKIGELQDIEHRQLDGISHPDYGQVRCFMSRPRSWKPINEPSQHP